MKYMYNLISLLTFLLFLEIPFFGEAQTSQNSAHIKETIIRSDPTNLFGKGGIIKKEYRYPIGLAKYAENYHEGRIDEALQVVRNILMFKSPSSQNPSEVLFHQLGWTDSEAIDTTKKFWNTWKILMDKNGEVRPKWIGVKGQIQYAKKYTNNSMLSAWQTAQYILAPNILRWVKTLENAENVQRIVTQFLNKKLYLNTTYMNSRGYLEYAMAHTGGDLSLAFQHSRYLTLSLQKQLNWYIYKGSIKDFKRDLEILGKYKGMEGLIEYAKMFHKNRILRAYKNALAVFAGDSNKLYTEMGWLPYYTSSLKDPIEQYQKEKQQLLYGQKNYHNTKGYIRFAKKYYEGDMHLAYMNAKALMESLNISTLLGWKRFSGTVKEFKTIDKLLKHYEFKFEKTVKFRSNDVESIAQKLLDQQNLMPFLQKDIIRKINAVISIKKSNLCAGTFSS